MKSLQKLLLPALVLMVSGVASVFAQVTTPFPPTPPQDVAARVSQLEAETQALRTEVQWLREHPVRLPATAEASMASGAAEGDYVTREELPGEIKKFAWKKGDFTITPYGFLWGNMVYSTERTNPGSYTLFVLSGSTVPEHEFIVDARNTRLGLDIIGPRVPFFDCAVSGGKVEIDFQNQVLSTENKPTILLRHAYLDVKDEDSRFLVGQTWDVISPLLPGMLMYSVGWDGGNIGYRRAQVRGERYLAFSDVLLTAVQLSLNQQIFPDTTADITGEIPNWPIIEGRVAWTMGQRGPGTLPVTFGLSGHIGEEEFDHRALGIDDKRRTWSANADLRVPITERFGFQGECQIGENLSPFLGGIGQGIDPTRGNTIRDAGGWLELWYDWTPTLHSHVGYSVDDPNNHDLHTVRERSYNQFYYGNLIYDLTKNFLVGMEVSSWKTVYIGQLPGDSVRCEFVAKYGF